MPRGWGDLGRQLAIWFGFALVYQVARGLADREPVVKAYSNGLWVVHFETQVTHRMYELTFEHFADQRHWLAAMVSWTYWNSEFTVVGLALLWVYIRRHEHFIKFRNEKVVEYMSIIDSFDAVDQMLGYNLDTHDGHRVEGDIVTV